MADDSVHPNAAALALLDAWYAMPEDRPPGSWEALIQEGTARLQDYAVQEIQGVRRATPRKKGKKRAKPAAHPSRGGIMVRYCLAGLFFFMAIASVIMVYDLLNGFVPSLTNQVISHACLVSYSLLACAVCWRPRQNRALIQRWLG